MDRGERGRAGERTAERMLRHCGLTILARNWRGSGGELDLTAMEGETLVFVEVKSRAAGFEESHSAVGRAQRQRMARAARTFRGRYGVRHLPFRFDLITVTGDPERPDEIGWQREFHRVQESS